MVGGEKPQGTKVRIVRQDESDGVEVRSTPCRDTAAASLQTSTRLTVELPPGLLLGCEVDCDASRRRLLDSRWTLRYTEVSLLCFRPVRRIQSRHRFPQKYCPPTATGSFPFPRIGASARADVAQK